MIGLAISKVVDKNNGKATAALQVSIPYITTHPSPVGAAPEGWVFVYKRCFPSLDFLL